MPRVKQFNEETVLNKAMELFWKKGFHATSMQDLVDNLGINRASLYDTFGGKQALFDCVFKRYQHNSSEYLTAFFESQSSVKEGFYKLMERAVQESINDVDAKGCFVVNTTTELVPGDKNIELKLIENRERIETIFYNFLQKGVASNEIDAKKDLKSIASFIFTMYSGLKVITKINSNQKKLLNTIKIALSVLD